MERIIDFFNALEKNPSLLGTIYRVLIFLKDNPIIWAITVVVSYLYGRHSGRGIEFSCVRTSVQVAKLGKSIDKLHLLYDGKEINDFTVTRFVIWNSGTKLIHWEFMDNDEPLRVTNNANADILNVDVLYRSPKAKNIIYEFNSVQEVKLMFETLATSSGIVVQIMHSGNSRDLQLKGETIDNDSKIHEILAPKFPPFKPYFSVPKDLRGYIKIT